MFIAAAVVVWTELFPKAHGQSEAQLRATSFAQMRLPDGVRLVASVYEPARWSGFDLLGGTPQVLCARLRQTFEVARADALRETFLETAVAAGKSRDDAESVIRAASARLYLNSVGIGYTEQQRNATVTIVDLPEPLGGQCTGGRLGTYETVMNF